MSTCHTARVRYQADTAAALSALTQWPFPIALDSAGRDRWDIVTAQPRWVLTCNADGRWTAAGAAAPSTAGSNADVIQRAFGAVAQQRDSTMPLDSNGPSDSTAPLPFMGGLIGFLGYEFAHADLHVGLQTQDHRQLPLAFIGYYDWALVTDHEAGHSWLVFEPDLAPELIATVMRMFTSTLALEPAADATLLSAATADISRADYQRHLASIRRYLLDGDCYQVNFTQRYRAGFGGSPTDAFARLKRSVPSPFSAYINLGAQQILCVSPERFLLCENRVATTQPIKGTRPRDADPLLDQQQADELQRSTKDRAENIMIVDLLRNDLGKVCEAGSIHAETLCELQSFANVHHLVSTVTGTLRQQNSIADLLLACFPGGSITGAPKRRAMQIINELETFRRTIYCGSIFYLSAHGRFDSNIAIRTLLANADEIVGWAGGGIVADSVTEQEYAECEHKIRCLFDALLPHPAK